MASATLISVEEYLTTSYDPDCDYVDGVLVERNVGEFEHSRLQGLLFAYLHNRRRELGIYVYVELRVQVKPTRFRVPDVCVVTGGRPTGRVLRDAPFLCIEILSEEDRMTRVMERISDYLAMGVSYVWVVDPSARLGYIYTPEGMREAKDGVLRTGSPGLSVSLPEIFQEIESA